MIAKRPIRIAAVLLASCAGAAWAQQEAPVPVKTDGLPLHVAARVKEKAAQGITALRQYVWISRAVNQLDLGSLIRSEEEPQELAAHSGDQPATVTALNEAR